MKMALGKGNSKMDMAMSLCPGSLCHHASPAQSIIASPAQSIIANIRDDARMWSVIKRSKILE
jgi:hypothetical protein